MQGRGQEDGECEGDVDAVFADECGIGGEGHVFRDCGHEVVCKRDITIGTPKGFLLVRGPAGVGGGLVGRVDR